MATYVEIHTGENMISLPVDKSTRFLAMNNTGEINGVYEVNPGERSTQISITDRDDNPVLDASITGENGMIFGDNRYGSDFRVVREP